MNGSMTVAVAGATGFVGRYIVRELLARGRRVRALVRDRARARRIFGRTEEVPGLTLVVGDLCRPVGVDELVRGADAAVNAVGILRESAGQRFSRVHVDATRNLIDACTAAGVRRLVQISALGVSAEGKTGYLASKWAAEQLVRRSGLAWTILRPGLIHGPESDFLAMAAGWSRGERAPWYFLPYFKRSEPTHEPIPLPARRSTDPVVQPVAVEDVALAVAACLERREAEGEVYNLVGPDALRWPDLLTAIRDEVPGAWEVEPLGLPVEFAVAQAKVAKALGLGSALPYDEGMAVMGAMDSVADPTKAREHLGFNPRPFLPTLRSYAGRL